MKLASIAVSAGNVTDQQRIEFAVATRGVRFLFEQKTQTYCDELRNKAIALQTWNTKRANLSPGEEFQKSVDNWGKYAQWFSDELDEMHKHFAPFLRIRG